MSLAPFYCSPHNPKLWVQPHNSVCSEFSLLNPKGSVCPREPQPDSSVCIVGTCVVSPLQRPGCASVYKRSQCSLT